MDFKIMLYISLKDTVSQNYLKSSIVLNHLNKLVIGTDSMMLADKYQKKGMVYECFDFEHKWYLNIDKSIKVIVLLSNMSFFRKKKLYKYVKSKNIILFDFTSYRHSKHKNIHTNSEIFQKLFRDMFVNKGVEVVEIGGSFNLINLYRSPKFRLLFDHKKNKKKNWLYPSFFSLKRFEFNDFEGVKIIYNLKDFKEIIYKYLYYLGLLRLFGNRDFFYSMELKSKNKMREVELEKVSIKIFRFCIESIILSDDLKKLENGIDFHLFEMNE